MSMNARQNRGLKHALAVRFRDPNVQKMSIRARRTGAVVPQAPGRDPRLDRHELLESWARPTATCAYQASGATGSRRTSPAGWSSRRSGTRPRPARPSTAPTPWRGWRPDARLPRPLQRRDRGCITNLPDHACVEVPGYVDRTGLHIPRVGDLPLGCAAVCNASISVHAARGRVRDAR